MKSLNYIQKLLVSLSIALNIFSFTSCRKLVETDPPSDRLTGTNVFLADATAVAVFNNIYTKMSDLPFQGATQGDGSINVFSGLGSDELTLNTSIIGEAYLGYYKNSLANGPGFYPTGGEFWSVYFIVYLCNDALDGLNKSTKLTPAVKQQLLGEAKFIRALYYFYLVNFFGDVPLAMSTDPKKNSNLPRSPKAMVYDQIITDLKDAEGLLSSNFLDGTLSTTTIERTRPTKWAASALLARVYLYKGNLTGDATNFTNAETQTTSVINNTSLFGPLPALNNVFLKNSREAIWQIQPTALNLNTAEGNGFIVPSTGPNINNPVFLSQGLRNSFESGDNRAVLGNWINKVVYNVVGGKDSVYFAYKYKKDAIASGTVSSPAAMTEYFMVLRLAEQYLIRAEARAKLGKIAEAQADLNAIRNRAGLPNTTANDQASLLTAILEERRHELFCEWGHRWLDLKRTGKIDEVMTIHTPIKSNGTVQWQPYQALYPIPYTELQLAPNLVQNPGY